MNCLFTNSTGRAFSLGTVSMTYLDNLNVFDCYQENHDSNSKIIFKATGAKKLEQMADDVKRHSANMQRDDIKEKLINFSNFLLQSEAVTMTIN